MTAFTADAIRVPVADPGNAAAFYAGVFGATAPTGAAQTVDLHGRGVLELVSSEAPLDSRFGRIVATYVLEQPSEVRTVMAAALERGAQLLRPAKKALFGSFSGSFRSPDGMVWKLASDKGKDTAEASAEPRPTEVTFILGVREPKESRTFYTSLGMKVDRDYGSKYIDFHPSAGTARICLMQSPVLAKDVGVADSAEASPIKLVHHAASEESPPQGDFTDPDGFVWVIEDASSTAS